MASAKKEESGEIVIQVVDKGILEFCILGKSPLIMNRMSQKVWFELLAPKGKKNATEKASSLKHDPIKEFRDSPYRMTDPKALTLLAILPTAFKRAMGTAALDTPGAKEGADWPTGVRRRRTVAGMGRAEGVHGNYAFCGYESHARRSDPRDSAGMGLSVERHVYEADIARAVDYKPARGRWIPIRCWRLAAGEG
jgi:hypothetical protein